MAKEWGALPGLFPLDGMLLEWLRAKATYAALFDGKDTRFTHARIDDLIQNQLVADKGATYANLSTSTC
jgi:homoaconitate hydratase